MSSRCLRANRTGIRCHRTDTIKFLFFFRNTDYPFANVTLKYLIPSFVSLPSLLSSILQDFEIFGLVLDDRLVFSIAAHCCSYLMAGTTGVIAVFVLRTKLLPTFSCITPISLVPSGIFAVPKNRFKHGTAIPAALLSWLAVRPAELMNCSFQSALWFSISPAFSLFMC